MATPPPSKQGPPTKEKRIIGVPVFPIPNLQSIPIRSSSSAGRNSVAETVSTYECLADPNSSSVTSWPKTGNYGYPPGQYPPADYGPTMVAPVAIPLTGHEPGVKSGSPEKNVATTAGPQKLPDVIVNQDRQAPSVKATVGEQKLRHTDFVAAQKSDKNDLAYERFSDVLKRANSWLEENSHVELASVETVTWTNIERSPLYTDNALLQRSMTADKKTKVTRGLRIWYFTQSDTFYETTGRRKVALCHQNYVIDKKDVTTTYLLRRLNDDVKNGKITGKIWKVETLHLSKKAKGPDVCVWQEEPEAKKEFTLFLRVLYEVETPGAVKNGELEIMDFRPSFDGRTAHNRGYEIYADLFKRAARWLYSNPTFTCISIQSLFAKHKEDDKSDSPILNQYTEHGAAHSSIANGRTEYLQQLRIVYDKSPPVAPPAVATSAVATPIIAPPPTEAAKFFYKTFVPSQLKVGGGAKVVSKSTDALAAADDTYEDLRQLEEKINTWSKATSPRIFSVETIATRINCGGQEVLGSEATFVYQCRQKGVTIESNIFNIRLFLRGDFSETTNEAISEKA